MFLLHFLKGPLHDFFYLHPTVATHCSYSVVPRHSFHNGSICLQLYSNITFFDLGLSGLTMSLLPRYSKL